MTGFSALLSDYHILGLAIGLSTFLIIGLFHPLVIKAYYYFGINSWWGFLIAGIAMCGLSVITDDMILSSLFGVVAFSSFWSIKEVFEQRERIRKGWFPANPRRKDQTDIYNTAKHQ